MPTNMRVSKPGRRLFRVDARPRRLGDFNGLLLVDRALWRNYGACGKQKAAAERQPIALQLAHLSRIWAPSPYLAVVLLGVICWLISYLWLIETKNINLDRVVLQKVEMPICWRSILARNL